MAVGIRIRGGANQIQISDNSPVYMAVQTGVLNASQKIVDPLPAGGDYYYYQRVYFTTPITTDEPPLIFFKITNRIRIYRFTVLGAPGAWTGFLFQSGIGYNLQYHAAGEWFAACTSVPKSSDKIGIRIRNKDTGEVIFDSGYKLVKFQTYLTSFRAATSAEYNRWEAYGNYSGESGFWVASRPADCYMLMNCLTGKITETPTLSYVDATMHYAVDSSYPADVYIGTGWTYTDVNGSVLGTYYYGGFIFAKLGN